MAKAAQPIDYNELVTRLEAISRAEMEPPLWDDKDLLFLHPTTTQATTCSGSPTAAGVGREGKKIPDPLLPRPRRRGRPPALPA